MEEISIRSIQHYLYCPHRWGLMEIDRAWAENYFIARAEVIHKRVHTIDTYSGRGKKSYTAVRVWNDQYGIYGVTDCIEKTGDKYSIVEYKPTMPKNAEFREEDAMQVFAQKLCADQVFRTDCEAFLYYGDTRKRVALPFAAVYDRYLEKLSVTLEEMRRQRREGHIPPVRKGQYCGGCSMKDMCMPYVDKAQIKMRERIINFAEEDT